MFKALNFQLCLGYFQEKGLHLQRKMWGGGHSEKISNPLQTLHQASSLAASHPIPGHEEP